MGIEEKAKAYDEALNKIKPLYKQAKRDCNPIWSTYEYLIPELRESEDERIRKELVAFFIEVRNREGNEGYWHDLKVADILSYLEKQKEPENTSASTMVPSCWEVEQKEQKPAEWSEEDEKMLTGIIERGSVQVPPYTTALREEQIEWLMNRLKSLRPSWKPSEEQMEAFKGYIEDFQARAEAAVGGWNNFDVMIHLYEQLKKLM